MTCHSTPQAVPVSTEVRAKRWFTSDRDRRDASVRRDAEPRSWAKARRRSHSNAIASATPQRNASPKSALCSSHWPLRACCTALQIENATWRWRSMSASARRVARSTSLKRSSSRMGKQLRTMRHKALMAALTDAREKAGLTQRELARRLGRAHSFVGKIESGERQLNVLEFCEYADALQADACELLRAVMRARG